MLGGFAQWGVLWTVCDCDFEGWVVVCARGGGEGFATAAGCVLNIQLFMRGILQRRRRNFSSLLVGFLSDESEE